MRVRGAQREQAVIGRYRGDDSVARVQTNRAIALHFAETGLGLLDSSNITVTALGVPAG